MIELFILVEFWMFFIMTTATFPIHYYKEPNNSWPWPWIATEAPQ